MTVELLNTADPTAVEQYERGFYGAFCDNTTNRLIRTLWEWDESAGRIRTRIGYADQIVLIERNGEGELIRALALGTSAGPRQSATYSFTVPEEPQVCEALTFFVSQRRGLAESIPFWNACRDVLLARGLSEIYGTCAPFLWPLYRWVGGRKLQTREIDNETRIFFMIDLTNSRR